MSPEVLLELLTEREREVLSLASEGKTSRQMAAALYLSKRTVDFHLDNAYRKLGVSNRIMALRAIGPALS